MTTGRWPAIGARVHAVSLAAVDQSLQHHPAFEPAYNQRKPIDDVSARLA
jgi:hypothetical protein